MWLLSLNVVVVGVVVFVVVVVVVAIVVFIQSWGLLLGPPIWAQLNLPFWFRYIHSL